MIVLSFDLDSKGRPVIGLFAAASASRIAALEEAGEPSPRPVEVKVLVDTGASRSSVQATILDSLELETDGATLVHTASTGPSPRLARLFALQMFFPGMPGAVLAHDLEVVELEDLNGLGVDMLLSRDVLDRCLLIFNGPEGRFSLAFGSSSGEA